MTRLQVLAKGFGFIEGLRWHDEQLWFSDFLRRNVYTLDQHGQSRRRCYVTAQPSGLGFTPDGVPLVVSMFDHWVLRIEDGNPRKHAHLGDVCQGPLNDMLVDAAGRAYVGCMGYDLFYEDLDLAAPRPATLAMIDEHGRARLAADNLLQPNGMALSPDGSRLVLAETFAARLTVFDVQDDGSLTGRATFADLGGRAPDGICMDRDGAIWAACAVRDEHGGLRSEIVQVAEGGEILDVIPVEPGELAITPILGGPDRRHLYCAVAQTDGQRLLRGESSACIAYTIVDTPGF